MVAQSRKARSRLDVELEMEETLTSLLMEKEQQEYEESVLKLWEDAEDLDDDFSHDENHKSGYVAIVGLPNVGKSTLLNSLLGQKLSIVTQKAQTTRNRIFGILSTDDYQV